MCSDDIKYPIKQQLKEEGVVKKMFRRCIDAEDQ